MYVNTQQRWNFLKVPPGGCERGRWRGEKIKRKLSEVNIRVVSRGQNELIGKLKMAPRDSFGYKPPGEGTGRREGKLNGNYRG